MSPVVDQSLASAMADTDSSGRAELLIDYLVEHGRRRYDEVVTQLEHGLQAATLARNEGASAELVTAALLHDLGHLLVDRDIMTVDDLTADLVHENLAADYLAPYFGPTVVEPIRLHVPAKRYLCTVDPDYHDDLSVGSKRSLVKQGGLLTTEEQRTLERRPYLDDAVRLRRWDDRAKVAGLSTPPAHDFRPDVVAALDGSAPDGAVDRRPARRRPAPTRPQLVYSASVNRTEINAITVVVTDMSRSVAFYRDLGFTVVFGGPEAEFTSLSWGDDPPNFVNLQFTGETPGVGWGRVIFFTPDPDAVHATALASGHRPEFEPRDAPWNERYFHIRDPDGHELSFAAPLPDRA